MPNVSDYMPIMSIKIRSLDCQAGKCSVLPLVQNHLIPIHTYTITIPITTMIRVPKNVFNIQSINFISSAQSRLSPKLIPKWIKRDLKIFSFFSVIIRVNYSVTELPEHLN